MTGWGQDWPSASTVIPPLYDGTPDRRTVPRTTRTSTTRRSTARSTASRRITDPTKAAEDVGEAPASTCVEKINPAAPTSYYQADPARRVQHRRRLAYDRVSLIDIDPVACTSSVTLPTRLIPAGRAPARRRAPGTCRETFHRCRPESSPPAMLQIPRSPALGAVVILFLHQCRHVLPVLRDARRTRRCWPVARTARRRDWRTSTRSSASTSRSPSSSGTSCRTSSWAATTPRALPRTVLRAVVLLQRDGLGHPHRPLPD